METGENPLTRSLDTPEIIWYTNETVDGQKKLLRAFKVQYGLTWPGVAEALGVALSTVEAWHSERNPLPYTGRTIIKVFMADPFLFAHYGDPETKEKNF